MKREKKSLRSDATDTHISDVSGDGHEGDYAAANLIVSRRSPSPSIREALEEQVREVEAEKMALQVQKAKLEVTSDEQISYRTSIYVAHSLVWQNM
jgi:exonuclease VII large subunit